MGACNRGQYDFKVKRPSQTMKKISKWKSRKYSATGQLEHLPPTLASHSWAWSLTMDIHTLGKRFSFWMFYCSPPSPCRIPSINKKTQVQMFRMKHTKLTNTSCSESFSSCWLREWGKGRGSSEQWESSLCSQRAKPRNSAYASYMLKYF